MGVVPRAAAITRKPDLTVALIRLSVDLEAVVAEALLLVQFQTESAKLDFMTIGQSDFRETLDRQVTWCLVSCRTETIIAARLRLLD